MRREHNISDTITKHTMLMKLLQLLKTGKIKFEARNSVLQTIETVSKDIPFKNEEIAPKNKISKCDK